jgi:DNA-directed RNA polymerase I and III subunit RPAC1
LKVEFHQNKPHDATFSLIGVDASIANAYRRLLMAEVPTLAIEDVFIFDNTSIIQDEVLAHRLGLIPLVGGEEGLRWMKWYKKPPPKDDFAAQAAWETEEGDASASVPNDSNTVVITLDVTCRWATQADDGRDGKKLAKEGSTDPTEKYVNSNVYAHQLVFEPEGKQKDYFSGENAIRPVNPDILIAKLRPGQRIHLRCHCIKGVGSDHAKFSPVATASYRLLPHINITKPILGADAKMFARCFPRGVIGLEDDPQSGEKKAVVVNPMKDTVSRECLRYDEFKDKVKLGRIRDHFIFSVESSGQFESDVLFIDSIRLLKAKAQRFKRHLTELEEGR